MAYINRPNRGAGSGRSQQKIDIELEIVKQWFLKLQDELPRIANGTGLGRWPGLDWASILDARLCSVRQRRLPSLL